MKTYIPEFKIGDTVWFKAWGIQVKIYITKIDYITLDMDGKFKYHLHGFVGEFEAKDLNVGWPVM